MDVWRKLLDSSLLVALVVISGEISLELEFWIFFPHFILVGLGIANFLCEELGIWGKLLDSSPFVALVLVSGERSSELGFWVFSSFC